MKIFFAFLTLILIISCNETSFVPDTSKDFMPLEVGNYWIFNHYEVNIYNNIVGGTQSEDSLIVVGTEEINNQTVSILIQYRDRRAIDTIYLYKDKNIIFRLYDSTKIPIPNLNKHWFPIIDLNIRKNNSWNIFNILIDNYPYKLEDTIYYSIYQHTFNGTYQSNDSIGFESKKFLSKKFVDKYDSRLTFKIKKRIDDGNGNYHYDSLDFARTLKYIDYYYLVEGIGFYKIGRYPFTLLINTSPSSFYNKSENYNGFVYELIRYYINR